MKLLPFIPARRRRKDRELPKAVFALFALLFVFLQTSALFGQGAYVKATDARTITVSGAVFTHINAIAELNVNVEYLISGSPTITSIIFQGCMRGGTCQTLSTYTSSTSTIISVTGLYDFYTVTPTWTGGSSPSVTINWLGTSNSSPGGATANVLDLCQSNTIAKTTLAVSITTGTTTSIVPVSGSTSIYICGYTIGFTGSATANTVQFVQGTGGACGGATANVGLVHRGAGSAASTNIISVGYAGQMVFTKLTAANGFCVTTTIATGPIIDIQVSFVQQ